jgi:hypothetical protein
MGDGEGRSTTRVRDGAGIADNVGLGRGRMREMEDPRKERSGEGPFIDFFPFGTISKRRPSKGELFVRDD